MKIKVYGYRKCDTCRKAYKFLESRGLAFDEVDITETAPSAKELRSMLTALDGKTKSLFNTSGQAYRDGKVGALLPSLSDAEALKMLAANGRLVKRPFMLVDGQAKAVGFKPDIWAAVIDACAT